MIDVLICGAGPAGLIAAYVLKVYGYRVVVMTRDSHYPMRSSETLPPVINKFFIDLGLYDDFVHQHFLPYHGIVASWGTKNPQEKNFIHDSDGHGWYISRPKFDQWLKKHVENRGVPIISPAKITSLYYDDYWNIEFRVAKKKYEAYARIFIDASGKNPCSQRLNLITRHKYHRQQCYWLDSLQPSSTDLTGYSYIQSCETGWWYYGPTPDQRAVLSYYSKQRKFNKNTPLFIQDARKSLYHHDFLFPLHDQLTSMENTDQQINIYPAHSTLTAPVAGHMWLTIGDAAISFDPLASQGIYNALYTAIFAAKTIHEYFTENIWDTQKYHTQITNIWTHYSQNREYLIEHSKINTNQDTT